MIETMKRLIFTAILFISMGSMAFAQQGDSKKVKKTPEEKAKHLTDELSNKLALTADQKTKVYAISLEGIKEQRENHKKGEKRDKAVIKADLEKRDAQISAVLNDAQKKTYQTWKTEKIKSMKKHGKKSAGTNKV